VQLDKAGKDSFKLRAAGAATTMLSSSYRRAIITEHPTRQEPKLAEELQQLANVELDLILVEGFKDESFAKIELHRTELNHPLLYPNDANIIAVAANAPLLLPTHLITLDINDAPSIAHFITEQFIPHYARPL
jgi:molybdopterin-guanine dinucleotide biosynthesis protein B